MYGELNGISTIPRVTDEEFDSSPLEKAFQSQLSFKGGARGKGESNRGRGRSGHGHGPSHDKDKKEFEYQDSSHFIGRGRGRGRGRGSSLPNTMPLLQEVWPHATIFQNKDG